MKIHLVKTVFRQLGLDIRRLRNEPTETLLGLNKRPVRTVVDVGANRGQFAQYISNFFPEAAIYCSLIAKNDAELISQNLESR